MGTGIVGAGSSPLTRGKRLFEVGGCAHGRLIPAHAGKTGSVVTRGSGVGAHPRSRGENGLADPVQDLRLGSSPLTRGKRDPRRNRRRPARLIPAHAGKTPVIVSISRLSTAHPRSRGENTLARKLSGESDGSSPLTRGKRRSPRHRARPRGLIPAHAGKTVGSSFCLASRPAHPRSRGENRISVAVTLSGEGSSPLTRGKQQGWRRHRHRPGLIPAHAGKTAAATACSKSWGAHPRSRGENPRGRL